MNASKVTGWMWVSALAAALALPATLVGCASARSEHAQVTKRRSLAAADEMYVAARQAPGEADGDPAPVDREGYNVIDDNAFKQVADHPLSTFSVDVDTASYANVRRMLRYGQKPVKDAVRIEEFINYFNYDYADPDGEHPVAVHTEVASTPWAPEHRLVKIGVKAKSMPKTARPASNLVFLIDSSGSMSSANKLPLLKKGLATLLANLDERDSVSIVAYAGSAGLVLEPTPASDKNTILEAIDRLQAGGSTNGGQGIELAYAVAQGQFIEGGVNRVLLATDGDFNVGTSSQGALVDLIEDKAKGGVFLSILGLGMGNLQDGTLELLSNKGNGNYAYIDTEREARKVLAEELSQTLVTRAKDVKLQIEFNPTHVESYRLIGYANRLLNDEDFNDDKKDAGDMGAGHTVTALYEVVMRAPSKAAGSDVDPLRYQGGRELKPAADSNELLMVKLRYKHPEEGSSMKIEHACLDEGGPFADASGDFRFAASVASFGMLLRDSKDKGTTSYEWVRTVAADAKGDDKHGYRAEFVELVSQAERL